MTEEELKAMASQLSHPTGEHGVQVGEMMNDSNVGMTLETIDALNLQNNDSVLELGHGNCGHLTKLLQQASELHYTGLELSETMHREAKAKHADLLTKQQAKFVLYDGIEIPFADNTFHKAMTVNTIYFWRDSEALLNELYRVIKPKGVFCIGFAQKSFMEKLPFAKYGFQLFNTDDISALVAKTSFRITDVIDREEIVRSKAGDQIVRTFSVMCLTKD